MPDFISLQNNVLVDGAGDVLLCDFGLSSDRENVCNTSTATMFNLRWTAPELIPLIDNSVTTYRTRFADIYSFGSVALQVHNLYGYLDCVNHLTATVIT
jgi:serine/threonine protein kinase